MMEGRSSGTAMSVAALRAVHQMIDDRPLILEDPVSPRLLDSGTLERILRDQGRYRSQPMKSLRSHIVLRSRYAEDCLADAVRSGVPQFVNVGAGYDTFPFRQPSWAEGIRIIEVDHPATQSAKIEILKRRGIVIPGNVQFLPLDLEKERLEQGLSRTDFDRTRPAFVACLGVLAYLRPETIGELFCCLGVMAKGSVFVFSFSPKGDSSQALAERTAAVDEPFRGCLDAGEIEGMLLECGFSHVSFLSPDEAAEQYYRNRSDLPAPRRATMGRAVI